MKITDKAKNFLLPCNSERIKLIGIVDGQYKMLVKHNCHRDKHYEYYIKIKDVKADINGHIGFIKKYMDIDYNNNTSAFSWMQKGDYIEFYVKLNIVEDNLYIERPTRINKITNY